jgi:putative exporter of polyketide antibiotics
MPRTFRLSLLRIEVRLREVMQQMAQLAGTAAMSATTSGAMETKAAVAAVVGAATKKGMKKAAMTAVAGPMACKKYTVQHAPKLPKGMCPSACHTIGETGA